MPSDVPLRQLRRDLEEIGYTLDRVKGSHHHFRGPNLPPIGFPVHHGKVKAVYARQVERIIKGFGTKGKSG